MQHEIKFFSLSQASEIIGITRAALMYRITSNSSKIDDHLYIRKTNTKNGKEVITYYLSEDYVSQQIEASDEEKREIELLYYSAYTFIESRLIEKGELEEENTLLSNSKSVEEQMTFIFENLFPDISKEVKLNKELTNFTFKSKSTNKLLERLFRHILKEAKEL